MTSFHDIRLPERIERGAVGGPKFLTNVVTMASGHEQRNVEWSQERPEYDISYGLQDAEDIQSVLAFFRARMGRAYGFRFKDWGDFQAKDQHLGTLRYDSTEFQLVKRYGDPAYTRRITRPVEGTVTVYADGQALPDGDVSVDHSTGEVTISGDSVPPEPEEGEPPEEKELTATFEFDVPVRFAEDAMEAMVDLQHLQTIPSIRLLGVRE
ncbi:MULTISPECIES: DUF2460 domain-containing protein [unclassified Thioalkalivibrio]|uniref:DUF2460 domain-containing protein n=1 Tax=unclassified Thioalkalivibrio TaxID=2621013 RepID=UPI00037B1BD3|nr:MULTISPECIES: DUF2460 domain-containing protein [unclassified Thioalkalivibrio]